MDQKEYLNTRINETKNLVKDKATELITRQEDCLITLKQSLTKIHNNLGSQSLKIIDYTAKTNQLSNKTRELVPSLEKAIHDLKQVSDDLRSVYSYKPPFELINIGKKKLMDPRILNYMKKFSYKDIPVNELTPGEMKRFMKFQIIMDNQIIPVSSQNTPSSKKSGLKNISVSNPFTKK